MYSIFVIISLCTLHTLHISFYMAVQACSFPMRSVLFISVDDIMKSKEKAIQIPIDILVWPQEFAKLWNSLEEKIS